MEGTVTIQLSDLDKLRKENDELKYANIFYKRNMYFKVLNYMIGEIIKNNKDKEFNQNILKKIHDEFKVDTSITETPNGIIIEFMDVNYRLL
jgi:isocitrate dehydrogenase kinase/phosphatase